MQKHTDRIMENVDDNQDAECQGSTIENKKTSHKLRMVLIP